MSESTAELASPEDPNARLCIRDGCEQWFIPRRLRGGPGSGKGRGGGKPQVYCTSRCGHLAREAKRRVATMPVQHVCARSGCGNVFIPREVGSGKRGGANQRYCTPGCEGKAREPDRRSRAEAMNERGELECPGCGGVFIPHASRQRFHGLDCLYAHRAGRRIDPPLDYSPLRPRRKRLGGGKTVAADSPRARECFWCGGTFTGKGRAVCPKPECGAVRRSLVGITHRHHISRGQYMALWREQSGKCAICCKPPGPKSLLLHVDHDHRCCPGSESCGQCVRGLLCFHCNAGIGQLNDDPRLIRAAADYIDRTSQGRLVLAAS